MCSNMGTVKLDPEEEKEMDRTGERNAAHAPCSFCVKPLRDPVQKIARDLNFDSSPALQLLLGELPDMENGQTEVHFVPPIFLPVLPEIISDPKGAHDLPVHMSHQFGTVAGTPAERTLHRALQDFLKDYEDKEMVVFHNIVFWWEEERLGEFDHLIVSKKHRCIIDIESKRESSSNMRSGAIEQHNKTRNFLQRLLGERPGWNFVRAARFFYKTRYEFCPGCRDFVIRGTREADVKANLPRLFGELKDLGGPEDAHATYLSIVATIMHFGHSTGQPVTKAAAFAILKDRIKSVVGAAENVWIWNQKDISPDHRMMLFVSYFGTGKTTVMLAKALELAENGDDVVFVLNNNGILANNLQKYLDAVAKPSARCFIKFIVVDKDQDILACLDEDIPGGRYHLFIDEFLKYSYAGTYKKQAIDDYKHGQIEKLFETRKISNVFLTWVALYSQYRDNGDYTSFYDDYKNQEHEGIFYATLGYPLRNTINMLKFVEAFLPVEASRYKLLPNLSLGENVTYITCRGKNFYGQDAEKDTCVHCLHNALNFLKRKKIMGNIVVLGNMSFHKVGMFKIRLIGLGHDVQEVDDLDDGSSQDQKKVILVDEGWEGWETDNLVYIGGVQDGTMNLANQALRARLHLVVVTNHLATEDEKRKADGYVDFRDDLGCGQEAAV